MTTEAAQDKLCPGCGKPFGASKIRGTTEFSGSQDRCWNLDCPEGSRNVAQDARAGVHASYAFNPITKTRDRYV